MPNRSKARAARTAKSMKRIDDFHAWERDQKDAKTEKRVKAFQHQKERYIRRCRYLDPWNNASMISHHGVDTSSAMHAEVPMDGKIGHNSYKSRAKKVERKEALVSSKVGHEY